MTNRHVCRQRRISKAFLCASTHTRYTSPLLLLGRGASPTWFGIKMQMLKLSLSVVFVNVVIVVAAIGVVVQADHDEKWARFKDKYNKKYSTVEEEAKRKRIWKESHDYIYEHNRLFCYHETSFRVEENTFADQTVAELFPPFEEGMDTKPEAAKMDNSHFKPVKPPKYLPNSLDWRKHGYVTPVKEQGNCHSGWAFATVGAIEGQQFKRTGRLVSLSASNLVDCTRDYGNAGCKGGRSTNAYEYIIANQGIDTEKGYPYNSAEGECDFSNSTIGAVVTDYVIAALNVDTELMFALAEIGPISTSIDASHPSFKAYSRGIYHEPKCQNDQKHRQGVLLVGYGHWLGQDYWIVKNSMGDGWGEGGYMRVSRTSGVMCGMMDLLTYPVMSMR